MSENNHVPNNTIYWDAPTRLHALKTAYQSARDRNANSFTLSVDGRLYHFVTEYAKFLIAYLDTRLDRSI